MKRYQVVTWSWDIGSDDRMDFSRFNDAYKDARKYLGLEEYAAIYDSKKRLLMWFSAILQQMYLIATFALFRFIEGESTMSNQEIFEMLADNEQKLFYASCADKNNAELKAAHAAARQALESFAKETGCHN